MSEYTLEVDPMGHHYFCRPDRTTISSVGALDEMNALLARAESAEKLCDYWEARAKAVENERDEAIRKVSVWEKIALREAKINGARLLNKEVAE